jgi:23S rRNA (adenine2503-C2)-methyltransferase
MEKPVGKPGDFVHLRDLTIEGLRDFVVQQNEPPYRHQQITSWMYGRLANDFAEMTDLPQAFRERLAGLAVVRALDPVQEQVSAQDGTRKFLFQMADGALVESVLMPYDSRITLCVSSQVGCPLDCVFCQTGKGVFARNLTSGEILDQICHLKREVAEGTSKVNLVFMGMGEPLLNYDNLVRAIKTLNSPQGLDTGSRRITVSTAGLPRRMRQLAEEDVRCSLALSLNASTDAQREQLMPAVSRHPIKEVLAAAQYFHERTRRRVTIEYVMLRGINTMPEDAERLGRLVRGRPFKVNLIPYNAGHDSDYDTLPEEELQDFIRVLLPHAPTVTVRRSRGPDIDAACGQLWTATLARRKSKTN